MEHWPTYVRRHLPPLACPPEAEAAIVDEIASQLEGIYQTAREAGASDADARARVAEEVADWPALAAALMAARYPHSATARAMAHDGVVRLDERPGAGRWLTAALGDLQHAVRALAASRTFTITAAITLALAIGATTAMFALVDGVLLAPLAYHDAGRLALVQQIVPELGDRYPRVGANPRSFRAWTEHCRQTCDELVAMASAEATLTGGGEPEGLRGARVTANVFAFLGLRFVAGGAFAAAAEAAGAEPVVIVSRSLWTRRLSSDPAIVGKTIELEGIATRVVGVLDDAPAFPVLADLYEMRTEPGARAEFFRPLVWTPELVRSWGEYDNVALARLKPGVTVAQTNAELDAITEASFRDAPIHPRTLVQPLHDRLLGPWRRPMWLLLAAVGAALTIACVNVANLLAGRWFGRARELAIRTAMGASARDLRRFVGAESLVLGAIGGSCGVATAWAALRAVVWLAPAAVPRLENVHLSGLSVLVAAVVAAACALLCAALSSAQVLRTEPAALLKAASHTMTGGPRAVRVRQWLVGVEIALTAALLVVGGLLVASMQQLLDVDPGFNAARVLTVDLRLPNVRYPTPESRNQFIDQLLSAVEHAPGVEAAGIVRRLPLKGEASVDGVIAPGDTRPPAEQPVANYLQISPKYFRAVGIRLVAGRWITAADRGQNVALISERTARAVWPDGDAIGKRLTRSNRSRSWEVVGIVADARLVGLDRAPGLTVYAPYWSASTSDFSLAVRTYLEPASALGAIRRTVNAIDATLPLQRVTTLDAVVDDTLATRRFQLRLMLGFAGAGILLACLGMYSVVAAAAERRTSEFALRLALGADRMTIVRAVLREAMSPVLVGVIVGVAGGVAGATFLAALFYEVAPYEPAVLLFATVVILATALAASLIPAARAMRTDPITAMRST
jgi:predicted permease